jgi:hypothetical protein
VTGNPHTRNAGLALGTLLASSTTVVCCVLPAVLVSFGAGAAVVSLVSAVPQLIWLSEHKILVFGIAAALLAISGITLWRGRRLACPVEPALARSCQRLRRFSMTLYFVSGALFAAGLVVTVLLPALIGFS